MSHSDDDSTRKKELLQRSYVRKVRLQLRWVRNTLSQVVLFTELRGWSPHYQGYILKGGQLCHKKLQHIFFGCAACFSKELQNCLQCNFSSIFQHNYSTHNFLAITENWKTPYKQTGTYRAAHWKLLFLTMIQNTHTWSFWRNDS